MPTISIFYGIAIRMYLKDHLPPHCHAIYGEHEAQIAIDSGDIIKGALPSVARRLVRDWVEKNREALGENWNRARANIPLERIDGLDVE